MGEALLFKLADLLLINMYMLQTAGVCLLGTFYGSGATRCLGPLMSSSLPPGNTISTPAAALFTYSWLCACGLSCFWLSDGMPEEKKTHFLWCFFLVSLCRVTPEIFRGPRVCVFVCECVCICVWVRVRCDEPTLPFWLSGSMVRVSAPMSTMVPSWNPWLAWGAQTGLPSSMVYLQSSQPRDCRWWEAGKKAKRAPWKHKRGRMQIKVWGFALKSSFKQTWSCFVEVWAQ